MIGMTADEIILLLTIAVAVSVHTVVTALALDRGDLMQTATLLRLRRHESSARQSTRANAFGLIPQRPRPRQRWTLRRKAADIEAVRAAGFP